MRISKLLFLVALFMVGPQLLGHPLSGRARACFVGTTWILVVKLFLHLIQTLLRHDLVDELWLKLFPVTLGPGKRLFVDGAIPAAFELVDSQVSPKGVIVANYVRSGEVETGSFGG